MNNKTMVVNHQLGLYHMFFLFARIVYHASSLIYRPWNLLFSRIYEYKKAWKVFLNFFWRFQPLCYWVYLLRCWYTLSYQSFNLLNISVDVALIQIKEKTCQRVCDIKTIVNQKHEKSIF